MSPKGSHAKSKAHIATHMLAFEGDSKVVWFEGNYFEYEADRKSRLGAAAGSPTGSSTGT